MRKTILLLLLCSTLPHAHALDAIEWEHVSGPKVRDDYGTYTGTIKYPGSRDGAMSWQGHDGNFWLFGGEGRAGIWSENRGWLRDLWKYDPGTNKWQLVRGDNLGDKPGNYSGAGQYPGGRDSAVTWVDKAGNFWMFGGYGFGSDSSMYGRLNDLWMFDPASSSWKFMGGSSEINHPGDDSNENKFPCARSNAVGWTDQDGSFYLFGGSFFDGKALVYLNDFWKYNSGSLKWSLLAENHPINTIKTKTPETPVFPPGRSLAISWTSGNKFWMFGGRGLDNVGDPATFNDFWEYDLSAQTWTCRGGFQSNTKKMPLIPYPDRRRGAMGWTDQTGNLWMFGGNGFDYGDIYDYHKDLWKYSVADNKWEQFDFGGRAYLARWGANAWLGSANKLYLFGGYGWDIDVKSGNMNDLLCRPLPQDENPNTSTDIFGQGIVKKVRLIESVKGNYTNISYSVQMTNAVAEYTPPTKSELYIVDNPSIASVLASDPIGEIYWNKLKSKPGKPAKVLRKNGKLKIPGDVTHKFLVIRLDADSLVDERQEYNNFVLVGPLKEVYPDED